MSHSIVSVGELLWDVLPTGPRLGGAAANFSCHARALGAEAHIVSCVGDDEAGRRLLHALSQCGMPLDGITLAPHHPTGSVTVELVGNGQPIFTIADDVAWDHITGTPHVQELFRGADAVYFGTLAQRTPACAETIRSLIRLSACEALRVFDVNLRQGHYSPATLLASLELANVLKLNDAELPVLCDLLGISGSDREKLAALVRRFELRLVAYTRGAEGSILHDGAHWCENPGIHAEVSDTVGAGDSFTAAVVTGLLTGQSIQRISDVANEVAAYVCGQDGAIPALPDHLRHAYLRSNRIQEAVVWNLAAAPSSPAA